MEEVFFSVVSVYCFSCDGDFFFCGFWLVFWVRPEDQFVLSLCGVTGIIFRGVLCVVCVCCVCSVLCVLCV